MAERSWPFDSVGSDRLHDSAYPARALRTLFSDGVVPGFDSELQVTQNSPAAANVLVGIGHGWVQGRHYQNFSAAKTLSVASNTSGNPRIDRVVLRRSMANRVVTVEIKQGTPAGSPSAPALTQSDAGDWEVSLAQIAVANNFTTITNANITDERSVVTATQTSPVPTGSLFGFGGTVAPAGYLVCDSSQVSRTTYANLFAIIGTAYGVGNGSTTFNLPDFRGRTLVGVGTHTDVNAVGKSDGVALSSRRMSHNHQFNDPGHNHGHSDPGHAHGVSDPSHHHTFQTRGGGGLDIGVVVPDGTNIPLTFNNMSYEGTGIGIFGAGTGMSNVASGTGASVGPQTGAEPNNTIPFVVSNVIIKI